MNDYLELFEQILEDIKQGFGDNSRIEVSEEDGCLSLRLVRTCKNNIKDIIANYKENLDSLDDCIFVDVLDELSTYNVNLKQFDELLNKEELTESEATYVEYLIDFTNSLIRQHLINKIQQLSELLDNF